MATLSSRNMTDKFRQQVEQQARLVRVKWHVLCATVRVRAGLSWCIRRKQPQQRQGRRSSAIGIARVAGHALPLLSDGIHSFADDKRLRLSMALGSIALVHWRK